MDQRIKRLLTDNRVDGAFHTHVSLITPKGKFMFNRITQEEFWNVYCDYIEKCSDPIVGIAEKPQQYLPVLADIDLRLRDREPDGDGLYDESQLKSVVEIYQSTIRQVVDCSENELACVVLEKDMYMEEKDGSTLYKHGFHLHFPYIFLSKDAQEMQVIPRVQLALSDLNLFSNLGIENSGSVVDKVCCKVPWLLYGSRKAVDKEPYKVTRVYNSSLDEVDIETAFSTYQIYNEREQLIPLRGKVVHYLPRILSISVFKRETKQIRAGIISPLKEKMKREKKSVEGTKLSVEENINMARRLLPLLADFRASDRNEWMTIGWLLHNISDGHPDGLDLWCDFSSRCEEKYDENRCIREWEHMVKRDLTIGTLRHFASMDSPEEYKKFCAERSNKHVLASLEGSHNDVAKALYEEYGDIFRCASITNKIWFQFTGHIWEQIEHGVFLREKISGPFVNKYFDAIKQLYDDLRVVQQNEKNSGQEAMITTKIKQVNQLIKNLKTATFKNNVLQECQEVFYDCRFRDRLDTNPWLIAFNNGVYDLQQNIFRPGRPEDFISKKMPVNYREFVEEDDAVQEVIVFLQKIFPDSSVRRYFLDVTCNVFVGGNREKIVVFWLGEGDNGKSVTQKFFELMLGKLAIKLNTNVITGKKPSAGSAFADLARAGGGTRWAVLEEPDSDEMINIGILKHLSGNDNFYARDLFEKGKDGREIVPMFKLVFIANKLPRMKSADKAVWNRVKVIPFESTFIRPGDPTNPIPETFDQQMKEKKFPMDKSLSDKIPGMVEAFAWVLLQHRKKTIGQPRVEPPKVLAATEAYRKQNDLYRQFIEENLVEDEKGAVELSEIYNTFRDWFRDGIPGHSVPIKNELEEYLTKLWGEPEKKIGHKRWKGHRIQGIRDKVEKGQDIEVPLINVADEPTTILSL